MSGQPVGILPITMIGAEDTLHWDTVVGEREKADSVLTTLLKARAPEVGWVAPEEQRREHARSEEHTSELQSHHDLVCRLLLEKKKSRSATCSSSYARLRLAM